MGQRPDKQKVIGEVFTKDRVREFLACQPLDGDDRDFHVLTKAYRGLPAEAFQLFVECFVNAGRNINALDAHGVAFVDTIRPNKSHSEFVDILEAAGAKTYSIKR